MKIKLLLLMFLLALGINAQTITTIRMGEIKLGMSINELNEIIGRNIKLQGEEDYNKFTVFTYEDVKYKVTFDYTYDQYDNKYYKVHTIASYSPLLKTLSNIGIGSTLDDLLFTYKNYTISIYKDWADESVGRIFELRDLDAGTALEFKMKNDIVTLITVRYEYEGC